MIFTLTSTALNRTGHDPQLLERAAGKAFTHAASATTGTVQQFWNAFCEAHRVLHRGGEMKEAA